MTAENKTDLLNFFITRKGQFTRACWSRACKVRKGSPEIHKTTVSTIRAGIDYNTLTAVEAQRASGDLPSEPQPLPWGEWLEFPYTIEHKGQIYLRLYPSANANSQVAYHMNGVEVVYEDIEQYLLSSEKRKDEDEPAPLCFTIKLNDLIELY